MLSEFVTKKFPLLLPYGLKCLGWHLALFITFRHLMPSRRSSINGGETTDDFPWKKSPALTAHRIVALSAMIHWTHLGFRHVAQYDYNAATESESEIAALAFVPAGYDIAQYAMGALIIWDIPSSLIGASGPTDIMMHLHHLGMVLVTSCVLGLVGPSSGNNNGIVGTHVAPVFLGVIELSSIPLQIVDLFHPKKSPHWNKFATDKSPSSFFQKVCATANEVSRILFAILFLLVRGLYFPYMVVTAAIPDFYEEGSSPSMVLFVMCILFTALQMYWGILVLGQVKKALVGKTEVGTTKTDAKAD